MNLEARIKKLESQHAVSDDYFSKYKGLSFEAFWDAIGRPEKNGVLHPIHPYEETVYNELFKIDGSPKDKHLWCKKSTGLGITEWGLRLMAWLCCRDDEMQGKEMFIVTGPRIELAKLLIKRMKAFFPGGPESKDTVIIINGCRIEAYPSHHVATMRGQNPKFIFIDEGDFFPPGQQDEVRTASERYIAKSDPYLLMVSTPNLPDGLFDKLEREEENATIYRRVHLPYTVGLGNIYTHEEITKAQASPSFEREYNLKYAYGIGNVWLPQHIEACTKVQYDPSRYVAARHMMGIDPGVGSSKFAFVITRLVDGMIQVVIAEEFERADPRTMIDRIAQHITNYRVDKTYIDGANPGYITAAKALIRERTDFDKAIDDYKRQKMEYERLMRIVPVYFSQENTAMMNHAQQLVADGMVAIHEQFNTLLTQMRAARVKLNLKLDKEDGTGATYDLVDAFFLSLHGWNYKGQKA